MHYELKKRITYVKRQAKSIKENIKTQEKATLMTIHCIKTKFQRSNANFVKH